MYHKLTLNSQYSWFSLLSAGIIGMNHLALVLVYFFFTSNNKILEYTFVGVYLYAFHKYCKAFIMYSCIFLGKFLPQCGLSWYYKWSFSIIIYFIWFLTMCLFVCLSVVPGIEPRGPRTLRKCSPTELHMQSLNCVFEDYWF
jgi:hypothetical protein